MNGAVEYGTCPQCGDLSFPVLPLSPCGHGDEPQRRPLDEAGVVYSWTRVWAGDESTLMAMADFLEGRLRVTAPVMDAEEIEIGAPVRVCPGLDTPYAMQPSDLG